MTYENFPHIHQPESSSGWTNSQLGSGTYRGLLRVRVPDLPLSISDTPPAASFMARNYFLAELIGPTAEHLLRHLGSTTVNRQRVSAHHSAEGRADAQLLVIENSYSIVRRYLGEEDQQQRIQHLLHTGGYRWERMLEVYIFAHMLGEHRIALSDAGLHQRAREMGRPSFFNESINSSLEHEAPVAWRLLAEACGTANLPRSTLEPFMSTDAPALVWALLVAPGPTLHRYLGGPQANAILNILRHQMLLQEVHGSLRRAFQEMSEQGRRYGRFPLHMQARLDVTANGNFTAYDDRGRAVMRLGSLLERDDVGLRLDEGTHAPAPPPAPPPTAPVVSKVRRTLFGTKMEKVAVGTSVTVRARDQKAPAPSASGPRMGVTLRKKRSVE